jgi:hypothetical protein
MPAKPKSKGKGPLSEPYQPTSITPPPTKGKPKGKKKAKPQGGMAK